MEFDLQRFADSGEQAASAELSSEITPVPQEEQPQEEIPEELGGLPEEYAREVMEQSKPAPVEEQPPAPQPAPEEKVSREDYQAVINEREQLKAQLAAYQIQQAQAQQQAQQPRPQAQQYQQSQRRLTPEDATKIKQAIAAEAMAITGMTADDVASLEYADDDDPRLDQWAQAKSIAQDRVYTAIRQYQSNRQAQAQQFLANHQAAVQEFNTFAQKAFAEPDCKDIQHFATNEFFEQLSPFEQKTLASAYIQVERQLASPSEIMCVKRYYEQARAAYRTRGAKKQPAPKPNQPAAQLPRADQLRGTTTTGDGSLSATDIEKMLEGDFTKLDPKQQRMMLGFS